jgi:hypothetical protein
MRSIADHRASLSQSIGNQREIHLLEVANTAVGQFRAAAGGSLCEIAALQQQRSKAARGCIYRGAESGGAAANYYDVPLIAPLA